jgi:hypothetical protein
MWKLRIGNALCRCTFTSVFHRILDFKTGPDFYPALFLCCLSTADGKLGIRLLLCLLSCFYYIRNIQNEDYCMLQKWLGIFCKAHQGKVPAGTLSPSNQQSQN